MSVIVEFQPRVFGCVRVIIKVLKTFSNVSSYQKSIRVVGYLLGDYRFLGRFFYVYLKATRLWLLTLPIF
jgi:hypothetical protein